MNNPLENEVSLHPFFQNLKPEHLEIVASCASSKLIPADVELFHEREPANRFYLIENGCISLEAHQPADGTLVIQTLCAGEVLGWSWLFAPFTWHFRARTLEPTQVIVLDGAHLLVAAERDHDFGYELMKRVAQVVIHRLQATREQIFRNELAAAS